MNHEEWDRAENRLSEPDRDSLNLWWCRFLRQEPYGTIAQFKQLLGRQTLTVVFARRYWVWRGEDWALYVSTSRIGLNVRNTATPEEAQAAVTRFCNLIEEKMKGRADEGVHSGTGVGLP